MKCDLCSTLNRYRLSLPCRLYTDRKPSGYHLVAINTVAETRPLPKRTLLTMRNNSSCCYHRLSHSDTFVESILVAISCKRHFCNRKDTSLAICLLLFLHWPSLSLLRLLHCCDSPFSISTLPPNTAETTVAPCLSEIPSVAWATPTMLNYGSSL